MATFDRVIWYLNIAATLVLLGRLFATGLWRTYRWLFFFFVADTFQSLLLIASLGNRNRYAEMYMGGQAVKMVLSVFVVLELYQLALASHPALAGFGRKTVGWLLVGSSMVAAGGLWMDSSVRPGQSTILHRFFTVERTMDFSVLIFLLLICCFMLWFPVRMKPNVALYIGGFVVWFLARSFGLLMANILSASFFHTMSNAMLAVCFGCLSFWSLALRRGGEFTTLTVGHRWNPAVMERLTGQLESINASLVRLSRD